jgi:hypothetical protein
MIYQYLQVILHEFPPLKNPAIPAYQQTGMAGGDMDKISTPYR